MVPVRTEARPDTNGDVGVIAVRSEDPSEREVTSRLARLVVIGLAISLVALAVVLTRA